MVEMIANRTLIKDYDKYCNMLIDGFEPLADWKRFDLIIELRRDIQNGLFGKSSLGKGNVVIANDKYYHWCYAHKLQVCEECCCLLHEYSARNVSHILTRGGHADIAHDPRNSRLLCGFHHMCVEDPKRYVKMKIWETDQIIIEMLRYEYS